MMAQESRTGSLEQDYNRTALPPPWQKDTNDFNIAKKRKREPVKTKSLNNQNQAPTNHVNTHNRFSILESTDNSMEVVETPKNQHTKKPSSPTNIH
jgi:hypothetical protein